MLTVLGVSGDIRSDAELAAIWPAVVWRTGSNQQCSGLPKVFEPFT